LNGKFALHFQVRGLLNLSDFQGGTLSGAHNFSDRDAVRIGITILLNNTDRDNEINEIDSTQYYYLYGNDNAYQIVINAQYIHHIAVHSDISFFVGAGPYVSFSSSEENRKYIRYGEESFWKRNSDGFGLGLELILGVEWMFYKNMILSAEYGMNGRYSVNDLTEQEDEGILETHSRILNVSYNIIKFGLSVYF
jgi:hypothetical protein